MRAESLVLRPLTTADEHEAWQAHAELAREGFDFLLDARPGDWPGYLRRLADDRAGVDLPPRYVPATFLVADVGGVIVGRVHVRHALTEALARVGGHIGYQVRPAHRRCGYATAMLAAALDVARAAGVEDALVTCDDDNVASARTIERCGGVLQDVVPAAGRSATRRYRVPTSR